MFMKRSRESKKFPDTAGDIKLAVSLNLYRCSSPVRSSSQFPSFGSSVQLMERPNQDSLDHTGLNPVLQAWIRTKYPYSLASIIWGLVHEYKMFLPPGPEYQTIQIYIYIYAWRTRERQSYVNIHSMTQNTIVYLPTIVRCWIELPERHDT